MSDTSERRMTTEEFLTLSSVARKQTLRQTIVEEAADVLRLSPEVLATRTLRSCGLDERSATELSTRVQRRIGISIAPGRLLSKQTLSVVVDVALVDVMMSGTPNDPAATGTAIMAAGAPDSADAVAGAPRIVSFTQSRLWFLEKLVPGTAANNVPSVVHLLGPLDTVALERSLREIVRRHETLRTSFVTLNGHPVPVVAPADDFFLPIVPVAGEGTARLQAALQEAATEAARAFDIERGPLFRARLWRIGPADHVLSLTFHHLVTDGLSYRPLLRELSVLYRAFRSGQPSPLPELTLQYSDFARRQHEQLADDQLRADLAYWQQHLTPLPPPLELPTDRPRPAFRSTAGGAVTRVLSRHTTQGLRDLSKRASATLFMTLLAGFKTLLYRYTAQTDIVVGIPITGRTSETEALIGFFANTLPLRTALTGELAFRDVIARIKRTALGAYEHQNVPFERIVDMLQPARDLSRTTVFDVMFALNPDSTGDLHLDDLVLRRMPIDSGTAKYDLTLLVEEAADELTARLEYNADLFDRSTAERMLGHLTVLLAAAVHEPDQWISRLPMLGEGERALLEHDPSVEAQARAPSDACLHERFAAHASARPDAIAVIAVDRSLTYGELDHASTKLGARLREIGAAPGTLIAVSLSKGWQQAVACLAVMKAGAAYLPVDPALPRTRRWYLAQNGQVRIVLTSPHHAALEWPEDIQILYVDDAWFAPGKPPDLPSRQQPGDLAYVIFTSGSTGVPKGVMIDHRAALNTIEDLNDRFEVGPADRILAISSLSFDLSVYDFFGAWAAGAAVVIPATGTEREPAHWAELIERHRVTIWDSVPALMDMLVSYAATGGRARLGTLRAAFLSGDWIPVTLPDRLRALVPDVRIISMGGATEASIWSIIYPIERVDPSWRSIPYGRGLRNQQWFVLDPLLEPCPTGVPGDLYIAGAGLAQGYWRDPGKTAASFIQHPRLKRRLYRTGDRGRLKADGNIEFLGREDLQVKIQGHRIELPEVERALGRHPAVGEMIVDVRKAPSGSRRLIAYVVPAADYPFDADALRRDLESKLPAYMVPSAFVQIDRIPLSENGKVQTSALPDPDEVSSAVAPAISPPQTATEYALVEVWAELLGGISLGCTDNFFAVGGHSLLAIHLTARLRDRFGIDLAVRKIFEAPTVRALAAVIDDLAARGAVLSEDERRTAAVQPAPAERHAPFPLADLPQAYWFGQEEGIELGNTRAHTYLEFELVDLDIDRLSRSLNRLIARHDMLRAVVLPTGEQRVLENVPPVDVPIHDWRGLDEATAADALDRLRRTIRGNPPEAGTWPLFHVSASLLDAGRWRLHMAVSLLIADARSGYVFFAELGALYQTPDADLPPLALTYRDYLLADRTMRESHEYQRAEAYWRARLGSLPPPPELPLACAPASLVTHQMTRRTATIDAGAWARLKARAGSSHISPNGVLCAAYAEVLAAWSRTRRFTLNVLYVNRRPLHPDVNRVFGNFSSTILLEVDFDRPNETFAARASRLQGQLWDDLDHSSMTGVRVAAELNRARGQIGAAGMPVVFASTLSVGAGATAAEPAEPGPVLPGAREVGGWLQTPQVWLDHNVFEREGALILNWDVVDELFPPGVVDAMFDAYTQLVNQLAMHDALWAAIDIPLVPAVQLVGRALANRLAQSTAPGGFLHEPLRVWASQTPDALAVVSRRRSLSYRELHLTSNTLARQLRERRIQPDTLVAIVMGKGWEQVVAAFAILEAGAAYLPIDARLPRERVHQLLAQGEVQIVVTTDDVRRELDWPAGIEILCVGDVTGDGKSAVPIELPQSDRQLAYVIFTSGSTGTPKGVMIEHHGAVNTIADVNQRFGVGPGDRILGLSSLGFDLSVYDVFGAIAAGATVVLPSERSTPEPAEWAELVASERVTVWNSVPALASMLADVCSTPSAPSLASLRVVLLSGDWIPVQLPDRLRALAADAEIVSLGGATEASIWSIIRPIDRVAPEWTSIPYGRPMRNQTFHVLDSRLQPAPIWVAGQLCIGGVGLARGYWRDDHKTRTSFFVHPETGERLYRTGDLGRYLADGEIEFLGRDDLQVKVQGFRIELGEIETVLSAHPAVVSCAVVARGDRNGRHLVAHVVPKDTPFDIENVRAHLANKLPDYMCPRLFVVREQLPLSANGKIDRQSLAREAPDTPRPAAGRRAARNQTERRLCGLWAAVLGVSDVGVTDDFFELGGDSLSAVRLIARVEAEFGRRLPLSALLRGGTVEALSAVVGHATDQPDTPLIAIQPEGDRPPLVLVHPVGGHVLCYAPLAQRLGSNQPVYGLESIGLESDASPLTSIEEMASCYLAALRHLPAQRPLFLGGWSLGGVVAFEMCRQLQAAGHEVAGLLLVDSWAPGTFDGVTDEIQLHAAFCDELSRSSGRALRIDERDLVPHDRDARLDCILQTAREANALPNEIGRDALARLLTVFMTNMRALAAYRSAPTEVPALVVRAAIQRPGGPPDTVLGWSAFCGAIDAAEIAGDHHAVFDDVNLRPLVERIQRWIERTAAASRRVSR